MAELYQNSCGNFPLTTLQEMIADFYGCEDFDFVAQGKKLRARGFFGFFDKSNCVSNDIMDMHYLLFYLTGIHHEKLDDAHSCGDCPYSFHPKYYIAKYKLDCIYTYFQKKGIDISCYLKAMNIHMIYKSDGYDHYNNGLNINEPNIALLNGAAVPVGTGSESAIENENIVTIERCWEGVTNPFPISFSYVNTVGETVVLASLATNELLSNASASIQTFLNTYYPGWTITVLNGCITMKGPALIADINSYPANSEQLSINVSESGVPVVNPWTVTEAEEPVCQLGLIEPADSDWLYDQLIKYVECSDAACSWLHTTNVEEDAEAYTFNVAENVVEHVVSVYSEFNADNDPWQVKDANGVVVASGNAGTLVNFHATITLPELPSGSYTFVFPSGQASTDVYTVTDEDTNTILSQGTNFDLTNGIPFIIPIETVYENYNCQTFYTYNLDEKIC